MILEEKATFWIKQENEWSYLEKTQAMWTGLGFQRAQVSEVKGGVQTR